MDISRFNRLSSVLNTRHTRRDTIKYTGLGLGTAAVGAYGLGHSALAQDATPAAAQDNLGLPKGERTYTMFIQTAQSGTWEPKASEEGAYTLTLTGLPAQTVYFSDRPERIVGTQSTTDFLNALGFAADNPPNAALVTTDDNGDDDTLVIELFNPVYTEGDDASGATLVYDARILENYQDTGLGRVALQQDDASVPASFAGASLFIDDCADGNYQCVDANGNLVGIAKFGCCYRFPSCTPCGDNSNICNTVPGCENNACTIGPNWKDCSLV